MPVIRIDFGYDGTNFHGFARQRGLRTVQGALEDCLSRVLKQEVTTTGAGRTDTGVHARAQVVSFETHSAVDVERLARSLNGILGPELIVASVMLAPDEFNARFSAIWREYRYHILNRTLPDPLRRHVCWHVAGSLDLTAMNEVAADLSGQHDFASFCRVPQGGTTFRTVIEADWTEDQDLTIFRIRANAFCHQMVRSLVGFCVDVGRGRRKSDQITAVLEARDRAAASLLAPPQGLILWEVGYQAPGLEPRAWSTSQA
jgi:tRNA pseudouridine38-40 synthase